MAAALTATALLLGLLMACVKALGLYMARIFGGGPAWPLRAGAGLERRLYRVCGVDPQAERGWKQYAAGLVLSARIMEEQKIAALDAGADDYVTKPFSAPELLARLRAALRRDVRGVLPTALLRFGPLRGALVRPETRGPEGEIHLTPLEYRVLSCLARQRGAIVMQRQLIREVWGPERLDDSRSLRVFIKNLRAKLEPDPRQPRYLVTETGLGY